MWQSRLVWNHVRVPIEIERVEVVVSCLIGDFSNFSHYESEVVSLCKIRNNRGCVCCHKVQALQKLEIGFWYWKLSRRAFFLSHMWHLFSEQSEIWCQRRPIVSSLIQEVPPKAGNVLILGFNFTISPSLVCCLGSQGDSHFFSPVN